MPTTARDTRLPRLHSSQRSSRFFRGQRALTLIELLIVIGLMLALAAIALPSLLSTLGERSFESAVEVTRSQLLLARAHAQAERRSVVVMFQPERPRIEARWFDPEQTGGTAGDDDETRIHEGWAYRPLPDEVRLTRTPPPAPEPGFDDRRFTDTGRSSSREDDEPRAVRLAVFLPDGSALLGDRVWIVDGEGRRGRIEVNPWTGLTGFLRLGDEQEAVRGADAGTDAGAGLAPADEGSP